MTDLPRTRYASSRDGTAIAFMAWGSGPAVVSISSPLPAQGGLVVAQETGGAFPRRIERLLAASHSLLAYDPRGVGESKRGIARAGLDEHVADLEAVLSAAGVDDVALAAYQHATPVAIRFTAENPTRVRRLFLKDPYVSFEDVASAVSYNDLAQGDWDAFLAVLASLMAGAYAVSKLEVIERFSEAVAQSDYVALLDGAREFDVSKIARNVACPTLVLRDRGNWAGIPAEASRRAAQLIPGAEFFEPTAPFAGAIRDPIERAARFLGDDPDQQSNSGRQPAAGFATILFTDVVLSTPMLTTLGDARMREVMRDHDAVCEAAITKRGGRVVKTIGDAFMAEFTLPSAAIEAAIAIQRGIREQFADSDVPVRLRIGINAGEPIVEDDDLHGASVVIAKRLESEADTGGILVSEVVRQAVAGKDFEFEDRGEVELKGFEQPVRAWAVRW